MTKRAASRGYHPPSYAASALSAPLSSLLGKNCRQGPDKDLGFSPAGRQRRPAGRQRRLAEADKGGRHCQAGPIKMLKIPSRLSSADRIGSDRIGSDRRIGSEPVRRWVEASAGWMTVVVGWQGTPPPRSNGPSPMRCGPRAPPKASKETRRRRRCRDTTPGASGLRCSLWPCSSARPPCRALAPLVTTSAKLCWRGAARKPACVRAAGPAAQSTVSAACLRALLFLQRGAAPNNLAQDVTPRSGSLAARSTPGLFWALGRSASSCCGSAVVGRNTGGARLAGQLSLLWPWEGRG